PDTRASSRSARDRAPRGDRWRACARPTRGSPPRRRGRGGARSAAPRARPRRPRSPLLLSRRGAPAGEAIAAAEMPHVVGAFEGRRGACGNAPAALVADERLAHELARRQALVEIAFYRPVLAWHRLLIRRSSRRNRSSGA